MSGNARGHHERVEAQIKALTLMRGGASLTDHEWKLRYPCSRIAPTIDKLRNAHGFDILGDGTAGDEYRMRHPDQWPQMVAVKQIHKDAYYDSDHWREIRERRYSYDAFRCVACCSMDDLNCHHLGYHLFNEMLHHVITLCESCHEFAHKQSRLKFPSGMIVDHVRALGIQVEFDDWLSPLANYVDQDRVSDI